MTQKNFYLHRLWKDVKHLSLKNKIIVGGFLTILIVGGFFLGSKMGAPANTTELVDDYRPNQVSVASVRELSQNKDPIRILGEVSSQSEATLRTEAQGRVTSVRVTEGQRVQRGQVIATIENATQVAGVAQAQAAVTAARAAIGTSQTLNQVGLENAEQVLREAKIAALNAIKTAYAQVDDAVRGQADTLFFNPETTNPALAFVVSNNQQLGERLGAERQNITKILAQWKLSIEGLSDESVSASDLNIAEGYAEQVRVFLSSLVTASLGAQGSESLSAAQITAWRAAASGSRSIVNGVVNSLSGVRGGLVQAETAVQISAEQTNQSSLTGNTTAQASVAQAEAALRSAQLNLAKTTISAPIDGVVTRLDIETGDFVSMLEPVALIANGQALEIIAYLNDSEIEFVGKGSLVTIGSSAIPGEVIQVAPTIDAATQKIEVKILPNTTVGLTDGQTVKISIQRSLEDPEQVLVPLAALKVLADGFSVLTINEDGITEAVSVEVGPVVGDRVLVYEGLSLDTKIITDVRGVKIGEKVTLESAQ